MTDWLDIWHFPEQHYSSTMSKIMLLLASSLFVINCMPWVATIPHSTEIFFELRNYKTISSVKFIITPVSGLSRESGAITTRYFFRLYRVVAYALRSP
jgi:hypothetical protein